MRFVRRDVRDLIAHQKNGHGASYRHQRVLRRRSRLKFDFREIFGVVRFSTFATLSASTGRSVSGAFEPYATCAPVRFWLNLISRTGL